MVLSRTLSPNPPLGAARAAFSDDRAVARSMTRKLAEVMTDCISANTHELMRVCKGSNEKAQEVLVTLCALWELDYPNRSLLGAIWDELNLTALPEADGKTLREYITHVDHPS